MSYYNVCPVCGANLDPGEICDCDRITVEIKKAPVKSAVSTSADAKSDIKIAISVYYSSNQKSRGRRRKNV